ncbi:hypothetical protein [Mycoplasmopsis pullorum]|uniref:hypothetical protein n=1 Tax=Mycoplasmopsis pullorum TaxID=48003 RepID=UPI0015D5B72C|nr:hypothetical protein [Mycoplasmopsis pullorum]
MKREKKNIIISFSTTNSIRKMINNYCLNENYSNSRSEVINNALINYLIKNDEKNEKD